MTTQPIASIVLPACNEAAVLGRTLDSLVGGAAPGEFDVLVVANGCTDSTAEVAARAGVRVLETATPGKANALRLGDEACTGFPRVYLDADVVVTADDLRLVVAALQEPGVLAAAPAPQLNLDGASWVMRRVHKVHDTLVGPSRALAGVGIYALDADGHARVFPMPDVLADDEWVHRSFAPDERTVVAAARSVVRPALTVSAHLRRRVRVRLGNRQLEALGKPSAHGRLRLRSLGRLVRQREVGALDATCYLAVLVVDRVMSRRQRGREVTWAADTTSRQTPSSAPA
jgi:glycosyltransferase involved in cell wall biosynthesis